MQQRKMQSAKGFIAGEINKRTIFNPPRMDSCSDSTARLPCLATGSVAAQAVEAAVQRGCRWVRPAATVAATIHNTPAVKEQAAVASVAQAIWLGAPLQSVETLQLQLQSVATPRRQQQSHQCSCC